MLKLKAFIKKNSGIQPYIIKRINKLEKNLFAQPTLGVFLRGTDYVTLKPKHHYIQPTIEQVILQTKKFMETYRINQIFLVTEDIKIYKEFTKVFGTKVIDINNNYIKYNINDCLSYNITGDKYEVGLNYLTKLLLLGRCEYLVSSLTNGSIFALTQCNQNLKEKFIFDIGKY